MIGQEASVERHKTAIRRYALSRPMALLLRNGVLAEGHTVFDYGCGHGHDVEILSGQGFQVNAFDPHFRPDGALLESDVVNLGYVLNVIENTRERLDVLQKAFSLSKRVLCVSVMTPLQQGYDGENFSDGVITKRKTFQKYFEQEEIKEYLESNLDRSAIPLEPGIFIVFRHEADRLEYLENKLARRRLLLSIPRLERPLGAPRVATPPRPSMLDRIREFAMLSHILDFIAAHGRVPVAGELNHYDQLVSEFGSGSRVEQAVLSLLDPAQVQSCVDLRKSDLEVMYATRRFDKGGYPKPGDVPVTTAADIKAFYGSYKAFLESANKLLYSLGSDDIVAKAFAKCAIGKHLPDAVYIHPSVIPSLPKEIRVLIGLAESLLGQIPECNILKLNKVKRKISFMVYEDFDAVAHPALRYTYVIDVPKAEAKFWNFENRDNPPILHRKETFVGSDYPLYEKFRKLTAQEEKAELLSLNTIGTRSNWEALLAQRGYKLAGHTLRKSSAK